MKKLLALIGGSALFLLSETAAPLPSAQKQRPNRFGYDFARSYDAERAAPAVHRVRYQDDHIMLMEVANPPGYAMQLHGHPYPSIFARSSGSTNVGGKGPTDTYLEPDGGRNGEHWHNAPAPIGAAFPLCTAADPQAPHRPVNRGTVPQHFYRIEFKRIDETLPGAARAYRYRRPVRQLYADDVVRLVEITLAPGGHVETGADADPAVLAFDTVAAFDTLDRVAGPDAGRSRAPDGMAMPRCMTIGAKSAIAVRNLGATSLHYYRLDFKRIEGADLADHWRQWYPFMTQMH